MNRAPVARWGQGGAIVLGHVLLAFALLQHAGAPARNALLPTADYMLLAFIAAPRTPPPVTRAEPLPVSVPRKPASRRAPTPHVEPGHITAPAPIAPADAVAQAPAAPAQTGSVDMEALRAAARLVDSERASTAHEGVRQPAPLRAMDDSALARAVQKAKRPDCQTKYAGGEKANILLLIPLAVETITDKGCQW